MRTATLIFALFVGGSVFGQCRTLHQIPTGQAAGYSYQQSFSYTVPTPVPVPVPVPAPQQQPPCLPPVLSAPPSRAPCQPAGTFGAAYGLGYQQQPSADYQQLLAYMQAALSQQATYYPPQALPSPTFAAGYYQQSQAFLPSVGYAYPSRSLGIGYIPTRSFIPSGGLYAGGGFGRGFATGPVYVPSGSRAFSTGGGFGGGLIGQFQQGVQTGGLAGGLERFTGLGNGSGQFASGALTGVLATRANLFGLGKGIR